MSIHTQVLDRINEEIKKHEKSSVDLEPVEIVVEVKCAEELRKPCHNNASVFSSVCLLMLLGQPWPWRRWHQNCWDQQTIKSHSSHYVCRANYQSIRRSWWIFRHVLTSLRSWTGSSVAPHRSSVVVNLQARIEDQQTNTFHVVTGRIQRPKQDMGRTVPGSLCQAMEGCQTGVWFGATAVRCVYSRSTAYDNERHTLQILTRKHLDKVNIILLPISHGTIQIENLPGPSFCKTLLLWKING